jgi:hypothetical protein
MLAPVLSLALAATPGILLPPWPLSADGELVGVRGDAPLAAEGARVEPVAPRLFRVLPDPDAAEVRLSAGAADAVAPVEPPPAEIAIALRGPPPVKGRDASVEIGISVPATPGRPDLDARPPEIVASSGRVRDLSPEGPGRFRAVYEPAATRHPEVAVLVALAPRCPLCPTPRGVGYAVVPLAAAIEIPGQSEPGARATLTIGGRRFGPVAADARGRFRVPVVVPPGAHVAHAETVDALGNRTRRRLDLGLPEVDRLACAAWPRALPADGRSAASLWCVTSTEAGSGVRVARLALSAGAGEIGAATPWRDALQRARFRAPAGTGGARGVVVAALWPEGGKASSDQIRIALAPLAPAEIVARVPDEPVALGATVPAETAVRDRNGDLVGRPSGPPGATQGFVAPDRFVARRDPGDFRQAAPLAFTLAPGAEAATLSLRREGSSFVAEARTVDGRPAAGVTLRFGSGAETMTDARGGARVPAAGPAETVFAANGARAAAFEDVIPPPAPFEISRTVVVSLRPPTPVDVIARVEAGVLRWRVEQEGRPVAGRAVALRSGAVVLGPAAREDGGGRAAILGGRGLVAVVDEATGVSAIVEVP